MSLPRFFLSDQIIASQAERTFELRLGPDDIKHARALRLSAGERIEVVDADNDFFVLQVEHADHDGVWASISSRLEANEPLPKMALFQGLPKHDKLEQVIRGGTEIGLSEFHPVITTRSISRPDAKRAASKLERWRSIAKSAAMQSGSDRIPEVFELEDSESAARRRFDSTLVFWEDAPSDAPDIEGAVSATLQRAKDDGRSPADVSMAIWIGPEGGLSEEEVETICSASIDPHILTLGSTILRTETAGIIAPALALHESRRWIRDNGGSDLPDPSAGSPDDRFGLDQTGRAEAQSRLA